MKLKRKLLIRAASLATVVANTPVPGFGAERLKGPIRAAALRVVDGDTITVQAQTARGRYAGTLQPLPQ